MDMTSLLMRRAACISAACFSVVLALAAASVGLVVYSVRRRWLLAELLAKTGITGCAHDSLPTRRMKRRKARRVQAPAARRPATRPK